MTTLISILSHLSLVDNIAQPKVQVSRDYVVCVVTCLNNDR